MKKIYTSLLTILLSFCLIISESLHGQESLQKEQLLEDFKVFESSLRENHPQLALYTPQETLDSFFIEASKRIKSEMSSIEFYRVLTPILPMLGNNHTNILPSKSYIEYLSSEAKRLPFSFYHRNDTLYVLEDASKEYLIKEGSRVEVINGIEVSVIINNFLQNISTDGYNRTQPLHRASRGFSRYYAYYFGLPEIFEIRYFDSEGVSHLAEIKAISTAEISKNRKGRKQISVDDREDYSFRVINDVGILTISTFSISNQKTFKRFLAETFKYINKDGIDKLIIDLRDNLGGFPEASNFLLEYLIREPISPNKYEYAITDQIVNHQCFVDDIYLKHFKRQNLIERDDKYFVKGADNLKLMPNKYAYDQDLVILMNANSSSTTGQLIGLIKSYTKSTFIGEESGGNPVGIVANDILTLILPHSKIEVRLPVIYSELNVDFQNSGRGIIPDIEIIPTINDLLSGRDAVLEQALHWIATKKN